MSTAAVRIAQTYTTPYIAHAPMETRIAVAEWEGDRLTVWTGTQQPFGVRRALADSLALAEENVRVVVPDTGSGFGGKHEPDVAIAAARLARAAGAPVRLQWSREDEFTWAYFRPAAVVDIRAGATSDGDLVGWELSDVNAGSAALGTPYDVPHERLRFHPAASPLRQGPYRALAATANNFARESCVDELAHALRMDPLEFRLRNLNDDRLATVLHVAAEHFGWGTRDGESGTGAGIAAGVEKGGRARRAALVRVDGDLRGRTHRHRLRVRRDRRPRQPTEPDRRRRHHGHGRRTVRSDSLRRRPDPQSSVLGVPGAAVQPTCRQSTSCSSTVPISHPPEAARRR